MKEGGTSLNKTFREYNLVFKGIIINTEPTNANAARGPSCLKFCTLCDNLTNKTPAAE